MASFFVCKEGGCLIYSFYKRLNNNTVSAHDQEGNEVILKGKGIAFLDDGKIDEKKIEKVFTFSNKKDLHTYYSLIDNVPYEYIETAEMIVSFSKKMLNTELNEHIYVTITDHLNYALQRLKENIVIKNPLIWEIQRFYPTEYQIGLGALDIIQDKLNVRFDMNEAASIALHIIDAELGVNIDQSMKMTQTMQDILNIIKYNFKVIFDENSLEYNRLTTHLKYFVLRAMKSEYLEDNDVEIFEFINKKYPEIYSCTLKIAEYVESQLNYRVGDSEKMYLTVHIQLLVKEMQEKRRKQV